MQVTISSYLFAKDLAIRLSNYMQTKGAIVKEEGWTKKGYTIGFEVGKKERFVLSVYFRLRYEDGEFDNVDSYEVLVAELAFLNPKTSTINPSEIYRVTASTFTNEVSYEFQTLPSEKQKEWLGLIYEGLKDITGFHNMFDTAKYID